MDTRHRTLESMARDHVRDEKPKNRVFETMTCVASPTWTVRVWREESTLAAMLEKIAGDPEIATAIRQHLFSPASILVHVGQMERVAAIEVIDTRTKCGALFYPDWR